VGGSRGERAEWKQDAQEKLEGNACESTAVWACTAGGAYTGSGSSDLCVQAFQVMLFLACCMLLLLLRGSARRYIGTSCYH
jgi:hypothetical protein